MNLKDEVDWLDSKRISHMKEWETEILIFVIMNLYPKIESNRVKNKPIKKKFR